MHAMDEIIQRHERIALQLSGGKDSLACLFLLKPHLEKVTVYWLNTGRAFPETVQAISEVRKFIPHFVEVAGNVDAVHAQFGIPSDIVPASATHIGQAVGHSTPLMQDRYSCCFMTMMRPMHERMLADGITLIIRGQRNDDTLKPSARTGTVENGIEYLFPIEDWSQVQVMTYLREQNAPIPRFYELLDEAPDCMTCTAWWEKGAAKYLKRYHYPEYQEVQRRLDTINMAVSEHIAHFNKEVSQ